MADRQTKVTLSVSMQQYLDGMQKAAKATRETGKEAEKLAAQRDAFQQLGRTSMLTGTALLAASALSVKAAVDWESAWAGVTKTVDGNAEEMAVLEDQLRSLATTLPATHQEIAAVAEAAGQLGVAREDVAAFTKTMIDLSETTNLTADEAATSIAQLMNVMQTAPQDVDNLGAALVALGNDGASTERDIVQMAQRIAGAGRIVGLTEAEVLGFANALASVGIEAEAGGTSISRIMTDIAMAVSEGGEDLERFAQVAGVSSAEFSKAFKETPAEAIATFVEGLGRINAEGGDVFATLKSLGQSDIRVSQALLGMANSGDLLRESLELGSGAWEDNLALIEEARKRYDTTEARIQIMSNSINDAAISVGEQLLPAVKAGADGVAGLAQAFADMPEPVRGLIGIFTAVAGTVALTGGASVLAVTKLAELKRALADLSTTGSRMALIGGGVTVAITALVAAVGALAVQHAEARQRAESYADAIGKGGDAIRQVAVDALVAEKSFLWMSRGSAADAAERLGASLETVTDAAMGNAKALDELSVYLKAADGDERALAEVMEQSGLARLEAIDAIDTLVTTLREQGVALEEGERLEKQRADATEEGAGATQTAAQAYKDAAAEAQGFNDELSSLIDLVNEANGVGQDAVSANIAYKDALAEVDEAIQKAKAGAEGYALGLDDNTEAGRTNLQMLNDMAAKSQDAAKKQFDLDQNTDAYKQSLIDGRKALIDRAKDLGANATEAENLANQIYGIPDETQFKVIAETAGAEAALARLKAALNYVDTTDPVIVVSQVGGGGIMRRAGGGRIQGPGTTTSDSIPLMASDEEHMLSAAEVKGFGGHEAVDAMRAAARSGQWHDVQAPVWMPTFGGGQTGGSGAVDVSVSFPDRVTLVDENGSILTHARVIAGDVVARASKDSDRADRRGKMIN